MCACVHGCLGACMHAWCANVQELVVGYTHNNGDMTCVHYGSFELTTSVCDHLWKMFSLISLTHLMCH